MEAVHTIGVVVRRTGVSAHALRAWERRYGVVQPARSEGGERLYTEADIVRLRLLKRLTEEGHGIGRIGGLSLEELRALATPGDGSVPGDAGGADGGGLVLADAEEALLGMDGDTLRAILMRAVVRSRAADFIEEVAAPLLRRAGVLWSEERICPAHEHVLSAELTRVLGWLAASLPVGRGSGVAVVGTPAGERHEFGAQFAAIIAAEEGWRVAYLGPDLPAADIARACEVKGAALVLLGVSTDERIDEVLTEISKVGVTVGGGVRVLVGGRGVRGRDADLAGAGATVVDDLDGLRHILREARVG